MNQNRIKDKIAMEQEFLKNVIKQKTTASRQLIILTWKCSNYSILQTAIGSINNISNNIADYTLKAE